MFQFNFLNNEEKIQAAEPPQEQQWFPSKQLHPDAQLVERILADGSFKSVKFKDQEVKYVESVKALAEIPDCPLLKADEGHSDLLSGVYEGGLKIWECTYDLLNYFSEHEIDLTGKNTLDLGCGAGLLGIIALISGSSVCFQDYNEEIITHVTIPNVFLNEKIEKCTFYSGDWSSFVSVTEETLGSEERKFDVIVTSETIYNVRNYEKLHSIFKSRLKRTGVIYLAAKTHYFGVGGGLRQFEDFVAKEGVFTFTTCWKCKDGLQREILQIRFKDEHVNKS